MNPRKGHRYERDTRDHGNTFEFSGHTAQDLYQQAIAIAETHHVSVDEVFTSAFAEPLASWQRLRERAARGNCEKYFAVPDNVPDVGSDSFDRI
jgi:hypothetical protein